MPKVRTAAPADHFSLERWKVSELNACLVALRAALPLQRRLAGGLHHGVVSAVAALCAYLPASALGLKQAFWSAMTAIAVTQAEFRATETTARDQFVGATIGGAVALIALLIFGQDLKAYAVAVVVAMTSCWVFNVSSASRLAGTTATIILLVPRVDSPLAMFGVRILEVGWGVGVAVAVVWLAARLPASWLMQQSAEAGSQQDSPPGVSPNDPHELPGKAASVAENKN